MLSGGRVGPGPVVRIDVAGTRRAAGDSSAGRRARAGAADDGELGRPLKEPERAPSRVGLSPEAADWLIAQGVRLIGIDYLTIESHTRTDTWDVHHSLLGARVLILENADLDGVPAGGYELVCLPARLVDADGSFACAILIRREP